MEQRTPARLFRAQRQPQSHNNKKEMPLQSNLTEPAAVDLATSASLTSMAQAEGWPANDYALALADRIRLNNFPLSDQRERLMALAGLDHRADLETAQTLAQHHAILESIFTRYSVELGRWLDSNDPRRLDYAERCLNAATKAQGASLRVLSALKSLRDGQQNT